MAAYNAWQNRSLIAAADAIGEAERQRPRGAFFGSIAATFSHLLWADRTWMRRLAGLSGPREGSIAASVNEARDWDEYKAARAALDGQIRDWAAGLAPPDLAGDLAWYSGAAGREVSRPRWILVTHLFNHQTHHRGQIHAMLTAAGARPEDTDLFIMPGL